MKTYTVITGPTRSDTTDTGKVSPSFADALNANLLELDAQGILHVDVQCMPRGDSHHVAYVSWDDTSDTSSP